MTIEAPPTVEKILAETERLGFELISDKETGSLLRALAASKPGGNLLEIGTGTGHATAWLLGGMDGAARLTSIDSDPERSGVANTILGGDHRLTLIVDDAAAWLRAQARSSYDLIFADAIPGKTQHLDLAWTLLAPGGLYVVDDLLPQPTWPPGHDKAVDQLLTNLDSLGDCTLVNLDWSTGICIAVRN